ncbi:DNA recombination protein RmuC [Christiangramia sp. SM2212]|uniref:DNA recombination protein RmuC n=1 Tax=Christiangramia sediminicola TaxID=3073267 RepID=A0ABU1EQ11_9FLAO|nr:DNA recombination protein RmuC [Christiangramia sp. SM2212]MDR5590064.1 DNA recombination protein RmuC [Christiangramia sp. SM2212]
MNEYLLISIIFLVALGIGVYIGKLISSLKSKSESGILEEKNNQLTLQIEELKKHNNNVLENYKVELTELKSDHQSEIEKLEKEREEIRREKDQISLELTRKNSEFSNLQERNEEQKAEVEKLQEKFTKEFENLANKILDQKSEKFTSLNKQNIENILDPLNKKIKEFEEKVSLSNTESVKRHAELGEKLKALNEQNTRISEEATNLTKALKGDTKMQGNWGEMVLERVLERSGLQKDSEYFVQQSFNTEEGKRVMPDVIIHLPGDKKMVVDSKVSLNAYERYINEPEETENKTHLKNHLISVRNRVNELSNKNYHSLYQMESPDFVLLFIPIEAAFAIASNEYPALYSDAFEKNIIIVTPTTLLAVLKTIDSMWQNEKQKQNAIQIATQAGALYDSFTNLTDELLKIGRQIGTVQNSYEGAMKKLTGKGNLIRRVEKLKKLGAKASKQLDQKLINRAEIDEDDDNEDAENPTLNLR